MPNYGQLRLELVVQLINKLPPENIKIDEIINTVDKLVDFIMEGKHGKIKIVQ
jgi:hypothetical protein